MKKVLLFFLLLSNLFFDLLIIERYSQMVVIWSKLLTLCLFFIVD